MLAPGLGLVLPRFGLSVSKKNAQCSPSAPPTSQPETADEQVRGRGLLVNRLEQFELRLNQEAELDGRFPVLRLGLPLRGSGAEPDSSQKATPPVRRRESTRA